MKKEVIFVILLVSLIFISSCSLEKEKICPDTWYIDAEPPGIKDIFISNEQRYDINNIDLDWVRENCEIKEPQETVQ